LCRYLGCFAGGSDTALFARSGENCGANRQSIELLARGAGLDYIPRVLTIKKLTKTLGGRTLLREAEMSINWGERVALVGPNGAGKSTLFRMILDEDSPDEGTIERDEYAITGYLPQEAGEPTDETIIEIAMGITPEMIGILRTIREHEAKGDLSHPDFA